MKINFFTIKKNWLNKIRKFYFFSARFSSGTKIGNRLSTVSINRQWFNKFHKCNNSERVCFCADDKTNPVTLHISGSAVFSLSPTLPKLRLSTRGSHDVANSTRMNYKDGSYCGTFLVRHWRRSFAPRTPDYSLFSARECFNVPRGAHSSSSQWRHVTRLRQGARVVLSLPPQHICLKLPALNNNFECVCVCVCVCACVGVPVRMRVRTYINTSAYNNEVSSTSFPYLVFVFKKGSDTNDWDYEKKNWAGVMHRPYYKSVYSKGHSSFTPAYWYRSLSKQIIACNTNVCSDSISGKRRCICM